MKNNIPRTLKGFCDFLPEEAKKRQWLKNKLVKIFTSCGFEPLETPTLESLELFAGQIGEDEKLFFQFEDAGGRKVAMRYDQTVPTCRVVAQNQQTITFPFKRYQIQPAFRAEKPQKGRYREFLQCDADIFGVASPIADAEVIALSLDIYRQLGFTSTQVKINDRSLLVDIPYPAIAAIDKLEKIGEVGVLTEIERKGFSQVEAQKFLDNVRSTKPNATIKTILEYLGALGFPKSWYVFEPTIARSFSYSSGPIWEVVIPGSPGSVLGGERFDQLTEKISGVKMPGTGFGLGFDRTLETMESYNLIPQSNQSTKALITLFSSETANQSVKLANIIRNAGLNVSVYPDPSVKLAKQVKYADKLKIPFVIILGDEEIAQQKIALKNMQTGEQQTMDLDQLIARLKNQD